MRTLCSYMIATAATIFFSISPVQSAPIPFYTGSYQGTYSGDDHGTWKICIGSNGAISGLGVSSEDGPFSITGMVTANGTFSAVAGSTSLRDTFRGNIAMNGAISGTWVNTFFDENGSFSGNRNGGSVVDTVKSRLYRYCEGYKKNSVRLCGKSWTFSEVPGTITDYRGNLLSDVLGVTVRYPRAQDLLIVYNASRSRFYKGSIVRNHELGHVFQIVTGQSRIAAVEDEAQALGVILTNKFGTRINLSLLEVMNFLLSNPTAVNIMNKNHGSCP